MRQAGLVLAIASLVLTLAGCGSAVVPASSAPVASQPVPTMTPAGALPSGPATPSASPTASVSPTPSGSPTPEATMVPFTLTSTAFHAGGPIPSRFTCDGADVSPDLAWDGVPPGTAALVLVVDDPDAHGFVHWLVLDIDPSLSPALPLGISTSSKAPHQGINDFGRVGWGGPCPPSGTHRYVFTLYALAGPLGLPGTPNAAAVRKALTGAVVVDKAVLQATYRRGG